MPSGMTMSVSSRSIWPWCASQTSSASTPGAGFQHPVIVVIEDDAWPVRAGPVRLRPAGWFPCPPRTELGGGGICSDSGFHGFLGGGKEDPEGGARTDFAGDFDPALVLLDDAVDGGQAEAGAFADLLGGEERFEDAVQRLLVHAAAGVGDAQADEPARPGFGLLLDIGRVDLDDGGGDEQLAALGHGIAGVDRRGS